MFGQGPRTHKSNGAPIWDKRTDGQRVKVVWPTTWGALPDDPGLCVGETGTIIAQQRSGAAFSVLLDERGYERTFPFEMLEQI